MSFKDNLIVYIKFLNNAHVSQIDFVFAIVDFRLNRKQILLVNNMTFKYKIDLE